MNVKFVALDCYGTLFEEKSIFENIFNYIANNYEVDIYSVKNTFDSIRKVVNRHLKHNAFMNQRQRYSLMFDLMAVNLNIENFQTESVSNFLMEQFSTVKIFPETLSVINNLRQNYKVGLLANADNDALTKLLQFNTLTFDFIITSESARAYKPDEKIFQFLIKELCCNPEEIVFIGNDLKKDIIGGTNFGIYSVWLNTNYSNTVNLFVPLQGKSYEINNLIEIESLLEKVNK